ncbi:MAG: MATE family efflux transporter [Lachnospiraceae bacterium]|nr:MATE family efflux transporter [Lachnospiraceae bacterium]
MKKSYEIDMCEGPIFSKVLIFTVPLILSSILQLLFNAADVIVVGRYDGQQSLAAVGSTSSLTNLLISFFMGLSVGANVLVARYIGARNDREVSDTVHTAIAISLAGGVLIGLIGILFAYPLLNLMDTPADVIDKSALYMRVYFVGMPVILLYNFGSAILRAIGDTRRPLYYLAIAGVLNVCMNLLFVIVFHMGVAGVALATVLSQCLSAYLVIRCLQKSEGSYKLYLSRIHINFGKLLKIAHIGLPAGLQGSLFSISNVLIQSSVNSFGSIAMAGNTASSNAEGFIYVSMNAVHHTSTVFVSQNLGGMKWKRIDRVVVECFLLAAGIGIFLGCLATFFGESILGLYSEDAKVISFGILRLTIIALTYFLCGTMDVMVGAMRGLGYAVLPMIVSLTGACLFRVIWIFTVFRADHSLQTLYYSYPISWGLTTLVHVICFVIVRKRLRAKLSM